MKIITSAITFIIYINVLNAQSIYFDHSIAENIYGDYTREFIADIKFSTTSNKYFVCGEHRGLNSNMLDVTNPHLYILDINGSLESKIVFNIDSTLSLANQILFVDDKILIRGRYDEIGQPASDYFLLETNITGELLDLDIYGNPTSLGNYNNEGNRSVVESYQNGVLSCGIRYTEQSNTNSAQIWINKIDLEVDSVVWEVIIDNPELIDVGIDIKRYELDSTYIVYTEQEELIDPNYDVQHIILYKIDDDGNILNQSSKIKTDPSVNAVRPTDMAVDQEGNIVIIARDSGTGYIAKLDSSFNILWEKNYQIYANESTLFKHCLISPDGNYVVGGDVNKPDNQEYETNKAGIVIKIDAETGDSLWYKEVVHYHPSDSVVPYQHYVEAFTLAPDSGFVLGGYVFLIGDSIPYNQAAWIKKVDKHGCSTDFDCVIPVGINEILNKYEQIVILEPNPVNNFLKITYNNIVLNKYQIVDVNGKVMKLGNLINYQMDVSFLPSGIYFLKFEGINSAQKFVKN